MENHKTWLLIADASQARLYSLHKARMFNSLDAHKNLELIGEFAHNPSRKMERELTADRMGLNGLGTFQETTSPKVHEAETFAMRLISHIDSGRKLNYFRDLILVAPPMFMGLLKKHMSHEMQKLLAQTIEKDYTHQNDRELAQNLLHYF